MTRKGYKQTEAHKIKIKRNLIAFQKGYDERRFWKSNVHTLKTKAKISAKKLGVSHNKVHKTSSNLRIRQSTEYKLWRMSVFKRDGFRCVWCGARFIKGVTGRVILNADHIKPFSLFPELRLAIDNGRTLCRGCHKTTTTYGRNLLKK